MCNFPTAAKLETKQNKGPNRLCGLAPHWHIWYSEEKKMRRCKGGGWGGGPSVVCDIIQHANIDKQKHLLTGWTAWQFKYTMESDSHWIGWTFINGIRPEVPLVEAISTQRQTQLLSWINPENVLYTTKQWVKKTKHFRAKQ